MPISMYIYGGLAGLAFGSAVAYLNSLVTKHYIKKNSQKTGADGNLSVMGMNVARQLINLAALLAVFLLRNVIPLPFSAVIIGTAVGLTLISTFFVWLISRQSFK